MSQEVLQIVSKNDSWITEEDVITTINEGIVWPSEECKNIDTKKSRRKSWHNIKFEKRRRKGVVDQNGYADVRAKRTSWWNIFAPQQWPRSRRASQDVESFGHKTENITWSRSKSKSVDHGLSSVFDLESLRLREALDNKDTNGSNTSISERKRTGPPENTTLYTVLDRDTLTSIAARFDTTPSELTKLNRLGTPFVFPGQQLYVPSHSTTEDNTKEATLQIIHHDDLPSEEKELLDNLRPVSPKPGHVERVRTPSCNQPSIPEQDEEATGDPERFLKINVRHITDGQGVVSGVLLVTPNAVMFDPNVSDPLVIEHGPEAYGVIALMEFVVNVAIYHDIAHMRVGPNLGNTKEKPEIYYGKSVAKHAEDHESDSFMVKDETFPELVTGDDAESVCSSTEREGDAFPKAFERDLVTPTNLETLEHGHTTEERRKSLLDHHWAIPSKDRDSIDQDDSVASLVTIQQNEIIETVNDKLVRQSIHDSGIDICDTLIPIQTSIQASQNKKIYSDADIILSKDWVPPITIAPTQVSTSTNTSSPGRKKTSSVSFSLDSNSGGDSIMPPLSSSVPDGKDVDSRKNKMLKRLSYPLAWMETLTGEKEEERLSQSGSIDNHHSSVFSKVFSSSPKNLVDFGTGLFLCKTPSEESGGSGGPYSGGSGGTSLTPLTGVTNSPASASESSSFFPTYIISSVGASVGAVGATVGAMGATVGGAVGATVGGAVEATVGAVGGAVEATVGAVGATVEAVGATVGAVGSTVGAVGRSSVGSFMRQPTENMKPPRVPPKLDYRSMVSVEDMPELFVSFDKLIPRPARSCDDPPLYLRLRMGKPIDKPISRSTPLMSYGKKKMRPEYWFSVPQNRIDHLYNFIQVWFPQLYGELDEEQVSSRGFSLVELDTELWSDDPTPSASRHGSHDGDITEITKDSWEVLPMSDDYRQAFCSSVPSSLDVELLPPELIGTTEILTDYHRECLCHHLPARAEGYTWTLTFSTSQHGFSLNSMYRKMHKLESPILVVIEDTDNNVFGALTSCTLQVSDHFYGTGESLLFRFTPHFQVYNWTGENLYFIKGNNESLSIGAGDGKFGLWLDGDLYQGRSESCKTYGNDPLTPNVDFVVKTLECWSFI